MGTESQRQDKNIVNHSTLTLRRSNTRKKTAVCPRQYQCNPFFSEEV